MSGFEINKIIASIIITIIMLLIISKVGDFVIDINKGELKENAYKIDIPESDSSSEEILPSEISDKTNLCHPYI